MQNLAVAAVLLLGLLAPGAGGAALAQSTAIADAAPAEQAAVAAALDRLMQARASVAVGEAGLGCTEAAEQGMKQTGVEHIGRSQRIPGVGQTTTKDGQGR